MASNPFRRAARTLGRDARPSRPPVSPARRTRLRLEAIEDRITPAAPTGSLDSVYLSGSQYVAQGWAHDTDVPNQPLTVHIYVAGNPNPVAYGTANQLRIVGSTNQPWGFTIAIPASALNPGGPDGSGGTVFGHTFQVSAWAIDATPGQPSALLTGSPKQVAFGDAAISSPDGQVGVTTRGNFAGGINSITWQGFNFINQRDQGRLFQTALWGIREDAPAGTQLGAYNPTEGGVEADIFHPYTHSLLKSVSKPAANALTTTTQMGLWFPYTVPSGQTLKLSDYAVTKDVAVGYQGLNNVIRQAVTVTVPANERLTQFQFQQIAFTNGYLTDALHYDYELQSLVPLPFDYPVNGGFIAQTSNPIIEATPVGSPVGDFAIALVTRQLVGGTALPTQNRQHAFRNVEDIHDANGNPVNPNDPSRIYGGIDATTLVNGPGLNSGTYSFETFLVVGTRASVLASLKALPIANNRAQTLTAAQESTAQASLTAVTGNGTEVAVFPGYGIHMKVPGAGGWGALGTAGAFNGSYWTPDPVAVAANANGDIVASFNNAPGHGGTGSYTGVYLRPAGSGTWYQILGSTYATHLGMDGNGRVVADFPNYGVHVWTPTPGQPGVGGWGSLGTSTFGATQWTPDASALAVSPGGDIVASFNGAPGHGGVGSYTGVFLRPAGSGTWYQILGSAYATHLGTDGVGRVVANLPVYGVHVWTPTPGQAGAGGWSSLGSGVFGGTQWTPPASALAVNPNGDIVANFNGTTVPGGGPLITGVYGLAGGTGPWQLISPASASSLAAGGSSMVLASRPGSGTWRYQLLAPQPPMTLTAVTGNGTVVANFPGYGIQTKASGSTGWGSLGTSTFGATQWTPDASALAVSPGGDIVASFNGAPGHGGVGSYTGVFLRPAGSGTWYQILTSHATELAMDGAGRVVAQTPVFGVQVWTPTQGQNPSTNGWSALGTSVFGTTQWTPDASALAVSPGGDIVASFNGAPGHGGVGSYTGVFLRPAGSGTWYQILTSHATELAMDGAGRVVAQTPGYGVQVWTPSQTPGAGGWSSLGTSTFGTTQWTPDASAVAVNANGDIVVSFNNVTGHDGTGLYTGTYILRASSTQWELLTPKYTFTIAIGPDGLVVGQFD